MSKIVSHSNQALTGFIINVCAIHCNSYSENLVLMEDQTKLEKAEILKTECEKSNKNYACWHHM